MAYADWKQLFRVSELGSFLVLLEMSGIEDSVCSAMELWAHPDLKLPKATYILASSLPPTMKHAICITNEDVSVVLRFKLVEGDPQFLVKWPMQLSQSMFQDPFRNPSVCSSFSQCCLLFPAFNNDFALCGVERQQERHCVLNPDSWRKKKSVFTNCMFPLSIANEVVQTSPHHWFFYFVWFVCMHINQNLGGKWKS